MWYNRRLRRSYHHKIGRIEKIACDFFDSPDLEYILPPSLSRPIPEVGKVTVSTKIVKVRQVATCPMSIFKISFTFLSILYDVLSMDAKVKKSGVPILYIFFI
jgi:hypothetical protein